MPDITMLILADHEWFREQFARLDNLQARTSVRKDALEKVWRPLADKLDVHAYIEEKIFYPQLLTRGVDDPEGETLDAIGDHNDIRDGVRDANAAAIGTDEWWAAVGRAREANDEHMGEEQREGQSGFRRHGPIGLREALGQQYREFMAQHPTTKGLQIVNRDPQAYVNAYEINHCKTPKDTSLGIAGAAKSWTVAEVSTFIESVRDDRLFACWLLSCYGLRRSEVMGLRWSDPDGDTLRVQRGRVAVGADTEVDDPKSKRSRRNLPMPAELVEALRTLKIRQKKEVLEPGVAWSDDRWIAVREDGTPVRPEWYSDEFQRLRQRAGLRRIHLKGLRNTSVSLMLDQRHPVHIVAGWHGHDPAVSLSIYSDAKAAELRAAGAALFG